MGFLLPGYYEKAYIMLRERVLVIWEEREALLSMIDCYRLI